MRNCTSPYAQTSYQVFIFTNVFLKPLLFGIGIIGNLLILLVFNRRFLRTTSAIYVYFTGLAVCDLLVLVLAVPRVLRDTALIGLDVGYSKEMAQYMIYEHGFSLITRHTGSWIIVFVAILRYTTLSSTLPKHRFSTISASRIVVFGITLLCLVLNFPAFFELKVIQSKEHCVERMILWDCEYTAFAKNKLYHQVYPWVILSLAHAFPFFLMVLFAILLASRIRLNHVLHNYKHIKTQVNGNEVQTTIIIICIIVMHILLELPNVGRQMTHAIHPEHRQIPLMAYSAFELFVNCLAFTQASAKFIFYISMSDDFQKTFRRTFCCASIIGDDYYEPLSCADILSCACMSKRIPRENVSSRTSTSSIKGTADSSISEASDEQARLEHLKYMATLYKGPNVAKGGWI